MNGIHQPPRCLNLHLASQALLTTWLHESPPFIYILPSDLDRQQKAPRRSELDFGNLTRIPIGILHGLLATLSTLQRRLRTALQISAGHSRHSWRFTTARTAGRTAYPDMRRPLRNRRPSSGHCSRPSSPSNLRLNRNTTTFHHH